MDSSRAAYVLFERFRVANELLLSLRPADRYRFINLETLNLADPEDTLLRAWGKLFIAVTSRKVFLFDEPEIQSLAAYRSLSSAAGNNLEQLGVNVQGTIKEGQLEMIAREVMTMCKIGRRAMGESAEVAKRARSFATALAMVFGTYLAGVEELDGTLQQRRRTERHNLVQGTTLQILGVHDAEGRG